MRYVIIGVSALVLLQLLVVLVCWRFGAMRSRAVTEPIGEAPALCDPWCPGCENPIHERPAEGSVWDALDRHLAAPSDTAAEDQAIAVSATSNDDHFVMWEAEIADDRRIAKHLRQMDRWSR